MNQIEIAEVLTIATCGLSLLVSCSYTFYCYGRLVGYRIAITDFNESCGEYQGKEYYSSDRPLLGEEEEEFDMFDIRTKWRFEDGQPKN